MTDQISNEAYKQIMIAAQDENEPCEDCISRQALITRLDDFVKWCKDGRLQGAKFALDVVGDMPPVNPQKPICPSAGIDCEDCPAYEPKTGWIPVGERLPEDDQEVIFSTKTGRVQIGKYHDDDSANQWYSYRDKCRAWNNVVTAWMPLPELYRAEGSDTE